jgi:hypothetical protein
LKSRPLSGAALVGGLLALVAVQGAVELAMGRPAICACGYAQIWYGDLFGSGLSQHFADWYSFTHITHGVLFYALAKRAAPRAPFGVRLLAAVAVEAGWEMIENTPFIIDRYRQSALAQGYVGDSVLNSASDTLFAIFGFGLAAALPVWATVALALVIELALGVLIHDNLILNIVQLIHPTAWLGAWQASGGWVGSGHW